LPMVILVAMSNQSEYESHHASSENQIRTFSTVQLQVHSLRSVLVCDMLEARLPYCKQHSPLTVTG